MRGGEEGGAGGCRQGGAHRAHEAGGAAVWGGPLGGTGCSEAPGCRGAPCSL